MNRSLPWSLVPVVLAAAGCTSNNNSTSSVDMARLGDLDAPAEMAARTDMASGLMAQVRLVNVHAIEDVSMTQPMDMFAGGNLIFSGIGYGQGSGYASVPAGGVQLQIKKAGSPDLLYQATVNFTSGKRYSLIGMGSLQPSAIAENRFRLTPVEDRRATPMAGQLIARFVNAEFISSVKIFHDQYMSGTVPAYPTLPKLTVSNEPEKESLMAGRPLSVAVTTAPALFGNLTEGNWTIPASMMVEGTELLLIVTGNRAAHTRDDNSICMVLVRAGDTTPTGVQVVKQNPIIYVAHAAPNLSANVNIFRSGARVVLGTTDIAYASPVRFILALEPTAAGDTEGHPLNVHLRASPDIPASDDNLLFSFRTGPLVAGERYLAVMARKPTDPSGAVMNLYHEGFAPASDATHTRVRVVDGDSLDAPVSVGVYTTWPNVGEPDPADFQVLVGDFTDPPTASPLPFPGATAETGIGVAVTRTGPNLSHGFRVRADADPLRYFMLNFRLDSSPEFAIPVDFSRTNGFFIVTAVRNGDWRLLAGSRR